MKIAELFVNLGIKGGLALKNTLGDVMGGLQKTADMSMTAKAGILGAVIALEEMTRRSVQGAVDLKIFAGATGLSTAELQKLHVWAEMNNVKMEEMTNTMMGLSRAQALARMGAGAPSGFTWFGLNQQQSPLEMFTQIKERIRSLKDDQAEIANAMAQAATLGFSPSMFSAARIGRDNFDQLAKKIALTKTEYQNLLDLNDEWNKFWLLFQGAIQKSVGGEFGKLVKDFVKDMQVASEEAYEIISDLSTAFGDLEKDAPGIATALKAIGLGLLAITGPVGLATAGLIALVKLLEDIHKYKAGEDSMIGDVMGFFRKPVQPRPFGPLLEGQTEQSFQKFTVVPFSFEDMFEGIGAKADDQKKGDTNITSTVHINIDGAKDPKSIALDVKEGIISPAYWQTNGVNTFTSQPTLAGQ